jgi:hypothetical protein
MYQAVEKTNYKYIATKIADWATTRYGWFIKGNLNEDDVVDTLADELQRLPNVCMMYVDDALNRWIDDGHKKPPSMPDILQMLRAFNNEEINNRPKFQIEDKGDSVYSVNASRWDGLFDDEEKMDYIKNRFQVNDNSDATKYWIKKWMKNTGWKPEKITEVLGNKY